MSQVRHRIEEAIGRFLNEWGWGRLSENILEEPVREGRVSMEDVQGAATQAHERLSALYNRGETAPEEQR